MKFDNSGEYMFMFKKFAVIASVAVIGLSSQAFATEAMTDANLIEKLPDNGGTVKISGIVDSVNGYNKFLLKDSNSKTINVNTSNKISLRKGDTVTVTGQLDAANGKQIQNASVSNSSLDVDTSAGQ